MLTSVPFPDTFVRPLRSVLRNQSAPTNESLGLTCSKENRAWENPEIHLGRDMSVAHSRKLIQRVDYFDKVISRFPLLYELTVHERVLRFNM